MTCVFIVLRVFVCVITVGVLHCVCFCVSVFQTFITEEGPMGLKRLIFTTVKS